MVTKKSGIDISPSLILWQRSISLWSRILCWGLCARTYRLSCSALIICCLLLTSHDRKALITFQMVGELLSQNIALKPLLAPSQALFMQASPVNVCSWTFKICIGNCGGFHIFSLCPSTTYCLPKQATNSEHTTGAPLEICRKPSLTSSMGRYASASRLSKVSRALLLLWYALVSPSLHLFCKVAWRKWKLQPFTVSMCFTCQGKLLLCPLASGRSCGVLWAELIVSVKNKVNITLLQVS